MGYTNLDWQLKSDKSRFCTQVIDTEKSWSLNNFSAFALVDRDKWFLSYNLNSQGEMEIIVFRVKTKRYQSAWGEQKTRNK